MYGKGPFGKAIDLATQLTSGVCPTCEHEGLFVSINPGGSGYVSNGTVVNGFTITCPTSQSNCGYK